MDKRKQKINGMNENGFSLEMRWFNWINDDNWCIDALMS